MNEAGQMGGAKSEHNAYVSPVLAAKSKVKEKLTLCLQLFFFFFFFSCSMQTLSCGMHAGSSSPTRDPTRAPCIGSAESYPLDHQGSPFTFNYLNGPIFSPGKHIIRSSKISRLFASCTDPHNCPFTYNHHSPTLVFLVIYCCIMTHAKI